MYDHEDRLREAMEETDHLLPDRATVWARVELLAQIYRRRSLVLRSAGGAALTVSLAAGLVQMHTFIEGGVTPLPSAPAPVAAVPESPDPASSAPRPGAPRPAPSRPSPSLAPGEAELNAFFEAGFGWPDAVRMARLWRLSDPADAKIEAGRRLLDGDTLPIRPPR